MRRNLTHVHAHLLVPEESCPPCAFLRLCAAIPSVTTRNGGRVLICLVIASPATCLAEASGEGGSRTWRSRWGVSSNVVGAALRRDIDAGLTFVIAG